MASISYSTLRQNAYTETGSVAALNMNASTSNSLMRELGAKLNRSFATSYGNFEPSVQLGWRHEYQNTPTQWNAAFAADGAGSTNFTATDGSPITNVGVLSLGMTLARRQNLSVSAKYSLEAASGYTAQTGNVQVSWQY